MRYIDLHVHSNASDGTYSPDELVRYAAAKNLAAFALTDHDTVRGLNEARNAALSLAPDSAPVKVIPGVELSASYNSKDIHILGLCIDDRSKTLCDALEHILSERNQRNEKMIKNLADAGIDISMDKLLASEGDAVLTRAHFAKYLTMHHYTRSVREAFIRYLSDDGPYYVPRKYLTPREAIALIRKAHGIPVLAHPLLYHLPDEELDRLVGSLKEQGLAGLEAIYSSNTGYDEQNMKRLAARYDLLITGGSDFHGSNKPQLDLGCGKGNLKIPYTLLEALEHWKKSMEHQ